MTKEKLTLMSAISNLMYNEDLGERPMLRYGWVSQALAMSASTSESAQGDDIR
jgi:hypothetical protein